MARKVTLYIEDAEIKLVVSDGKKVLKWASLVLEQKLVSDGVVLDEKQIAQEIKNIMEATEVGTKKIIVALSGLNSVFRFISFPAGMPAAMLDEAIINEARRVLPVSVEQIYLSYQHIASNKDEAQYFLAAYPRNATDTLINAIKAAGLKVQSLDLAPLALARCVNEPSAVIVNSWLTYLDIIVLVEGLPKVIRSLSLPIESDDMGQKLPIIGEEINRTISYYKTSYPDKTLDDATPVMVCGDLSNKEDELKQNLSGLNNGVFTLTAPFAMDVEFPASQYMVNIGMFLKGQLPKGKDIYYSIVDIEALPKIHQPPAPKLINILVPVLIVVALAGIFYGWLFLQNTIDETKKMRTELSQLQTQNASLNTAITNLNKDADNLEYELSLIEDGNYHKQNEILLEQRAIDTQKETNLLPIAEHEQAVVMQQLLDNLSFALDKTNVDLSVITGLSVGIVDVLSIGYGVSQVDISGIATSEDNIYAYARALRDSGQFVSVIVNTVMDSGGTFEFSIYAAW
ncbi:MAG: pilus assembly protein PilM [Dehalococcoidales bacterium]|nr:pilus assembly protein PilM [Dehalococcoidales bacterium]